MTKHPAAFSPQVLEQIDDLLWPHWLVLDPFAGIGRVHQLHARTIGVELEHEWASQHPDNVVGNALRLPFKDGTFDACATSPCYGNRMADHHNAKDGSHRRTYKHYLGRDLHPDNSGQLQWGPDYRTFHLLAWREVYRVLKLGALFCLNVSDHIRAGQIQQVSVWHAEAAERAGFDLVGKFEVKTKRYRFGENSEKRTPHEYILLFRVEA